MAVGRQDYQAGVVPIKSGYSLVQSSFFKWFNKDVTTGSTEGFCTYTVGVGYQLNLAGYRIVATLPFLHHMGLYINGAQVFGREFYTEVLDNFPEGITMTIMAGQEFEIRITNQDTVTVKFYATIYGYLEQIES